MDEAAAARIGQQLRSAFPEGAIARVQLLEHGDDPEVEPGETAIRVFFDWPGLAGGKTADPKTVHTFVTTNAAALGMLRDELPRCIGWVEFLPEGLAGADSRHRLAYRITDRWRRAATPDEVPENLTPVTTRLGPADLAAVDTLITAGIASSRAEAIRWAVGRIREHPAYPQLQERVHDMDEPKT
jgi:hypothetical protein